MQQLRSNVGSFGDSRIWKPCTAAGCKLWVYPDTVTSKYHQILKHTAKLYWGPAFYKGHYCFHGQPARFILMLHTRSIVQILKVTYFLFYSLRIPLLSHYDDSYATSFVTSFVFNERTLWIRQGERWLREPVRGGGERGMVFVTTVGSTSKSTTLCRRLMLWLHIVQHIESCHRCHSLTNSYEISSATAWIFHDDGRLNQGHITLNKFRINHQYSKGHWNH